MLSAGPRTHLLLHCEDAATVPPPSSMSGKGEPLAKIARPPVAAWACSAVHSDLDTMKDVIYNLLSILDRIDCLSSQISTWRLGLKAGR